MSEPEKKQRLSLDEILTMISTYAQDPDAGPDRFRALKFLASTGAAGIVLPSPVGEKELIEMMSRLMIGCGPMLTQAAYQRAFPMAKRAIYLGRKTTYAEATPEMKALAMQNISLPILRRNFPEVAKRRTPKGYPIGKSSAAKMAWCQDEALKILVERERAARMGAHDAMRAAGTEVGGGMEAPQIERQDTRQEPLQESHL